MKKIQSLFLALTLGGCSDSLLFEKSAHVPPPAAPHAPSPTAAPKNDLPAQVMTFQLDPDASRDEGQVFQEIFSGQALDPFQIQNAQGGLEVKMTMTSVSVVEDAKSNVYENHVHMQLTLSVPGTSLLREYESFGQIVLKNAGAKDTMDGELRAIDGRGGTLFVSGDRTASATEDLAKRNPWSGNLLDSSKLKIGRFQGFAN